MRARRGWGLAWMLVLVLHLAAWAEPQVDVSYAPEEPYENQSIRVTIRVSGPEALGVRLATAPPRGEGLEPAGRPSTSQQTYSVNGRAQTWVEFGITYVPQRAGLVTIPAFRFEGEGGAFETKPISLQVREGSAPGARAPGSEEALPLEVQTRPSSRKVYLGEKLTLEYVLRDGGARPRGIEPERLDPLAAFLVDDDQLDVAATARETRDARGRTWMEYTLFRRRLTPTRTGTIEIPPVEIRTSVPRKRRDSFGSAFGFERYVPVSLVARGLSVEVLPLPAEGRPPGFEGAVGQFALSAKLPERARVGEAFQLEVTVRGQGALETLEAPRLDLPPDLQAYEAVETGQSEGARTWSYPLVARAPGQARIEALGLDFFDPVKARYARTSAGPFVIEIEPGRARVQESAPLPAQGAGETLEEIGSDLRYVDAAPRRLVNREDHVARHRVYWGLLAFPFLAGPLALLGWRSLEARAESASGRRARALRDARRTLERAAGSGSADESARAVVSALHRWCELVIGEPSRPLERGRLRRALVDATGDEALARHFVDLLDRAEAARYGGADLGDLVDEARALLARGVSA